MPTEVRRKNIDGLFGAAVQARASDLHLVAEREPYVRVHGELRPVGGTGPLAARTLQEMILGMLTKEQQDRFLRDRELDIAYSTNDARFRVNIHFEKGVVGLAARLIPVDIPTPADLALNKTITGLTSLPHGLVLVTGPTGSGKSTTLAALINQINLAEAVNIITLEDPIEFLFPKGEALVRQRQLGEDMITFGEGLKHLLRQDPDVVMIGEMRDLETISTTLTLAETGHLVFATLHTYSAATTIERIIDVFPPHQQNQIRVQLSSVLRAVIVQQLLPKRGGGRVAAREIMLNTPALSNIIRDGKTSQIQTVIQTSAKIGMCTLEQDLRRLVDDGSVEKEQAERLVMTARDRALK